MTYVDMMNHHFEISGDFSPRANLVYMVLLYIWSRCGREESFMASDRQIASLAGMCLDSVQKGRKELIEKGLIKYKPSHNVGTASTFSFDLYTGH